MTQQGGGFQLSLGSGGRFRFGLLGCCLFFFLKPALVILVHEPDGLNVVAIGDPVEFHDISGQNELAVSAKIEDRVVREKVRNDLIARLQAHPTGNLASFGRICILFGVKEGEKVDLPGNPASLLHDLLLRLELHTLMVGLAVHFEFFLGLEGLAALRASHFEGGLELDLLISVHLHLFGMIIAILFLSDLVLGGLSVPLEQLLAHEALHAGPALESSLRIHLVIRAERTRAAGLV